MGHTRIQPVERLYELTRQRASAEDTSTAAVVRKAVARSAASPVQRPVSMEEFTFIGSGRSQPVGPQPLSERHDDALAEDFQG